MAHAVKVVAPIDMGVNLNEGDRPLPLVGTKDGDGDGVVAADDQRQCTSHENLAYRRFSAAGVLRKVVHIAGHVAAVEGLDVLAHVERAADVEIVALQGAHGPVRCLPDGVGRPALLVVHVLHGVGIAMRDAEESDVGTKRIEIRLHRHVKEALVPVSRGDGERQLHRYCSCGLAVAELDQVA